MAQMFLAVITSGSQGSVTVLSGGRCDLSRGSVRRCCQSARLALGSIQAGSSNRWENKIASLRGSLPEAGVSTSRQNSWAQKEHPAASS